MRVTALMFVPPGRGEFYRNTIDMPDDAMPKTTEEFAARSIKACKHFWPDYHFGKALTHAMSDGGRRCVIDGGDWSVEWAKDEHVKEMESFMREYMSGDKSNIDYINLMFRIQPNERREL